MNRPQKYYNFTYDTLRRWVKVRPGALALLCVDLEAGTEVRLTFAELYRKISQTANFLVSKMIEKGDRVVVMLPRVHEWWVIMLALDLIGAIPAPASLLLTESDLQFRVKSCRPKAVITDAESTAQVDFFDGVKIAIHGKQPGWIDYDTEVRKASDQYTYTPTLADEPAVLYFTSATSGHPKMVVHSHTSYSWAHHITGGLWLDLRPGDLHWNISDLGWGKAAWSSLYGPWSMGAAVFVMHFRKLPLTHLLSAFEKYSITTFCSPPTVLRLLVRENIKRHKFPVLRHCVSAGEPLNKEVSVLWKEGTGQDIYEGYGQTETIIQIANVRTRHLLLKPGSIGQVMPGYDIHLLDETQQEVDDGTEGEIAIRVAPERPIGLFTEYWGDPEKTLNAFQNGWYLTGDRAVRDPDGYFWFKGRADDVIKSSDFRIGPAEVESTLQKHPAVCESAVVGKPDKVRGQLVKAFVVLKEGYEPNPNLAKEIQRFCQGISATYRWPREIEFVPSLPHTASGKLIRSELRELEKHRAEESAKESR